MFPLSYVGYMKSKNFQKSQNKAKIGQKSQNWPKRPKISKKAKKKAKKAKIIQNWSFCQILAFWNFLAFLENLNFFEIFGIFWEILDFLEQVCCLSFRRLHKDYIDQEYMRLMACSSSLDDSSPSARHVFVLASSSGLRGRRRTYLTIL
jgi:hypothetical protein